MAEPMKIRVTLQSDVADVKVLMIHPMETGQRKDPATGELVPAHFIKNVIAMYEGNVVLDAQWSQGISKNPFLEFRVNGAKAGDKVSVGWEDSKGEKNSIEATVAPPSR